jgi:alcohol dehydrogenase class IV
MCSLSLPSFEFAVGRIVFGAGRFSETGALVRDLGTRALVVTGRSPDRYERLTPLLDAHRVAIHRFVVSEEPTIAIVREGVAAARRADCDLVIGLGGGSALDAAKSIAVLATNDGDVLDFLEVIGAGRPLVRPSLPCVAIPTTAGTGSEVTRNAVLGSPEHRVKASLRSPLMLPRLALIDPELTWNAPPEVTAASGLDAVTQLIEAYVCRRANALSDALCLAGIRHAAGALGRAVRRGDDVDAREAMAIASLFGGLALSNSGLGAVHGLAGPLGGMLGAPHGALCAVLVPGVVQANSRALAARDPDHPSRPRLDEVARILTGRASATAEDGAVWLRDAAREFGMPGLAAYGLPATSIPDVINRGRRANSMKANPIDLTTEELAAVLDAAM